MAAWNRSVARLLRRLWQARDGSALVEFAFVGPVLVTSFVATMEIGMVLTTQALMEGAVRDAARYGVTGQNDAERLAIIGDIIADRTIGLVDIEDAQIEILTYGSFDDVGAPEPFVDAAPYNGVYDPGENYTDINSNGQWDPDQGKSGAGDASEVVVYRILYDAPSLTGLVDDLIGAPISLTASIAVRNEPWNVDQ
jgi:Flp pilus assembly protein TadG